MGNTYDVWWKKGEETDDDMARDHQESWQRIIQMLDPVHIKGQTILDFGCNQGGFYDNCIRHMNLIKVWASI